MLTYRLHPAASLTYVRTCSLVVTKKIYTYEKQFSSKLQTNAVFLIFSIVAVVRKLTSLPHRTEMFVRLQDTFGELILTFVIYHHTANWSHCYYYCWRWKKNSAIF